MGRNENRISVPVVVQGKDICRIIFQKAEDGKYDIKFEFRGNPYDVYTYRLFSLSPIIWNVDDPQHINMSYHHGANHYPVLIHLKDETKKGQEMYRTLPITRIQAPNTNQLFPIPLVKMEIPQKAVDHASLYKEKSYHHKLDLNDVNVIEVFMTSVEFDFDQYVHEPYCHLLMPQIVLSFEYFATGSVISDYGKSSHFFSHEKPVESLRGMGGISGMQLFVVMYKVPLFDQHWDHLHVTFIENELAEEILLCTKVAYPEPNPLSWEYDGIFLGGPTLEQLRPPAGPLRQIPVMCNTTVLRVLHSEGLREEEKRKLEYMAGKARAKLYDEMKHFEQTLERQRQAYMKKASVFLDGLEQLKKQTTDKVFAEKKDDIIYMNSMEGFILSDTSVTAEGIHILFARFCGLEQAGMIRVVIKSKKMKKQKRAITRYGEGGIPILEQRVVTADNTEFSHPWLILDDMLSIDLFRKNLNMFLDPKGRMEPDFLLFRSRPYFKDDDWDGYRRVLENRGYICEGPHFKNLDQGKLKAIYEQNDGLLEKVYDALMMIIRGRRAAVTDHADQNNKWNA